jgi:hypothetical protein
MEGLTDEEFAKMMTGGGEQPAPAPAGPDQPLTDEQFASQVLGVGTQLAPGLSTRNQAYKGESRWGQMLLNGLTFGLRPRIQATIESGAVSGPEYDRAKQEQWAKDDAYRDENPGTALALEMAGSVPTMFVPGLGAGRLATAAARVGRPPVLSGAQRGMRALGFGPEVASIGHEAGVLGAKTAAVAGGLGSRSDTVTGRLEDAAVSAPLGYGIGRAGDALLRPLVRVGEEVADAARVGGNAELGAQTALRRGLERDGVTPQQLRDTVLPDMGRSQVPQGGREAVLISYGDEIAAGANPGVAQQAAVRAYIQHARAQGSTLTDATLARQASQVVRRYTEREGIPLAIDEVARLAGGRGQNLQWTRRAAANSPGEGREQIFNQVTSRQEDMVPRFSERVSNTLGDEGFLEAKEALVAQNRAREDALYGIARQHEQPFDISGALDEVNATHAFRGGKARTTMEEAMRIMRGDPLPDGSYQRHTLDSYIQSRSQLNDLIDESMDINPATGARTATSATRALMDLKSKMDEVVRGANPRWGWANDIARGGRSVGQAMDEARGVKLQGTDKHTQQVLRRVSTLQDRVRTLRRTSASNPDHAAELGLLETQLEGYRMGFARVLHDELARLGDTHDVSKLFLKGGRNARSGPRHVVETMMGEDTPAFMQMVERAKIAGTTYKNQFNSQTTPLREAMDEAKQETKIAGALRALGYIASPRQMVGDLGELISNRLNADRNTALLRRYGATTENPADFLRLLNELENFALGRNRAFTSEGLNLYSAPGIASGAFSGASVQDQQGD